MRIEIKERNRNFFDECLYIQLNIKKVLKKINKKVENASKFYLRGLIVYFIYSLIFIVWGIIDGFDVAKTICSVAFGFFTLIMIYDNYVIKKHIDMYMNDDASDTVFEINEDVIRLENSKRTIELNWNSVKYVVINKETISFLPNNLSVDSIIMFISTKYKDEVIDVVKKYKKEELIVDNGHLYEK